jgi:methylmalonyl-CoA/ethylmalonyl-CoA epimerase
MTLENQPIININWAKQVGYAVYDCEKYAERLWNLFGIGSWQIYLRDPNSTLDNEMMTDMMYHKKQGCFSFKVCETTLGPNGFFIELIQPLSGENMYSDFLREHGEGIQHIGWHIVNTQEEFDKATSLLEGQGFPCVESHRTYASKVAYFDTTSVLNTMLEVSFRDPNRKRLEPTRIIYPNLKADTK